MRMNQNLCTLSMLAFRELELGVLETDPLRGAD